jgi:hypothetical protein
MKAPCQRRFVLNRSGAAAVECAIALPAALFVLFALLDLGLATVRYNVLAEGARRVARAAIIHGSLAPSVVGTWGPDEFSGSAADDSPVTAPIADMLPTMARDAVAVRVTWLDGDNGPRDRVQVELAYDHQSLIPFMASWGDVDLRAATTMRIVN